MKSVLISIKPKWCELIASGRKTIEVRKTKPNLDAPFKCYMYMTKDAKIHYYTDEYGDLQKELIPQRVIGEFVCDRIDEIGFSPYNHGEYIPEDVFEKTCLSFDQMYDYTAEEFTYGWHISDLVIYGKPRELGEFFKIGALSYDDWLYGIYNGNGFGETSDYEIYRNRFRITRPPQSWCYVEEL